MKVDRLIGIILLLLEKGRVGAQELAELFEVSPRTIYRDIEAVNQAGIPVLSTPGAGGGFEILPSYKLDKKVFSASELAAILTGLSGLSGLLRGEELAEAQAKVRSLVPAERAREIQLRVDQIRVDLSPWTGARDLEPALETIKTALEEGRLLSFEYTDLRGSRSARRAEPYQLVLKGNQWYWHGYCLTRGDFRLFKLSRTTKLRLEDEVFTPREHRPPELELPEGLAGPRTAIRLRVQASLLERLADFCPAESFAPDGEGRYLVEFPFVESDYSYDLLLGFGERCECLGPPRVREELRRRIQRMAALYEEGPPPLASLPPSASEDRGA